MKSVPVVKVTKRGSRNPDPPPAAQDDRLRKAADKWALILTTAGKHSGVGRQTCGNVLVLKMSVGVMSGAEGGEHCGEARSSLFLFTLCTKKPPSSPPRDASRVVPGGPVLSRCSHPGI